MYQPAATERFSKIEALTTLVHEAIETSVATFRAWRGNCHPDTVRLEGLLLGTERYTCRSAGREEIRFTSIKATS